MACKPNKAMARLTAKESYFIEASTPKELASILARRLCGVGSEHAMEKEVNLAIQQRRLMKVVNGYVTMSAAQHKVAKAKAAAKAAKEAAELTAMSASVNSTELVGAVA